ncbi:MAG: zinc ribbon domain-containing protein, partial [Candidatus Thermoplasmatota archaeon]|nr:zinc ribbon domain-containing protein [Candidatus Thermoplasmatota archaeon]
MYETDDDIMDLLLIPRIGRARARSLYSAGYRNAADIAAVDPTELAKVPGISLEMARVFVTFCTVMDAAGPTKEKLETPSELFICPLCGSMVSAGSNTCSGCGIAFSDDADDVSADGLDVPTVDTPNEVGYRKQASLFICPECGSLVSDGSESCPKCGVQFEQDSEEPTDALPTLAVGDADGHRYKGDSTLFMCPNCGSFIKSDANNCGSCGIVFEADDGEEEIIGEFLCPMCSKHLRPETDRCGGCGFDFTKEKENDGFWYKGREELFMCPDCGAFIPQSATQCGNCGVVLEEDDSVEPEAPLCPACKNEFTPGTDNCAKCGFDFKAEKEKDEFWYKDSVSLFICPGCGAFLSEAADNCQNCGLVFEGDEIPETETQIGESVRTPLTLDSELEKQVDDLIELVEIEDELDGAVNGTTYSTEKVPEPRKRESQTEPGENTPVQEDPRETGAGLF